MIGQIPGRGRPPEGVVGLGDKVVLQVGRSVAVQSADSSTALAAEVGGILPSSLARIRELARTALTEAVEYCGHAMGGM